MLALFGVLLIFLVSATVYSAVRCTKSESLDFSLAHLLWGILKPKGLPKVTRALPYLAS
ncbi:hypothetical protein NSE_0148 [Neorickettsia sennetsu str. Miyayama]|uniref:Uncharacterized protein n=1 Tax=Ehrlichia sennetsu (strain ATCC VR-367 / Miyayama) TaxID=222891 RepID=Q2GEP9_EHRS3|nr:hypothetical protein NSE_0148 [Neorickettsia sennetsu str. Miyayama]